MKKIKDLEVDDEVFIAYDGLFGGKIEIRRYFFWGDGKFGDSKQRSSFAFSRLSKNDSFAETPEEALNEHCIWRISEASKEIEANKAEIQKLLDEIAYLGKASVKNCRIKKYEPDYEPVDF